VHRLELHTDVDFWFHISSNKSVSVLTAIR